MAAHRDIPPSDKSVGKSVSPGLTPFQKGVDPRRGNGPRPGSGGRPTNFFKDFLRRMRADPDVQLHLERTLKGQDGGNRQAYSAALKLVADYDEELSSNMTMAERKARVLELVREAVQRQEDAEG